MRVLSIMNRKHSLETRQKIRIARKAYLAGTTKRSWQVKQAGKSIPCEKFKEILNKNKINYIPEFEPLREMGRYYSIDVSFPDKKIGIEINGRQHYDSYGNLAPYYQLRHDLIEAFGWKLYEIPYHMAFDEEKMMNLVLLILNSENKIEFNYKCYSPPKKKTYIAKRPNNIKYNYPPYEQLKEMAESMFLKELVVKLNIPQKALWLHLAKRGIKTKKYTKPIKFKNPNKNRPSQRKVPRPSPEELQELIKKHPMTVLGRKFGISDNAIRKWCRSYNIDLRKKKLVVPTGLEPV